MKRIPFKEIRDSDYGLFSVFAFPQYWQSGKSYEMPEEGRPDSGLMFITDCENTMISGSETVKAKSGQIVYLPQGARYCAHFDVTQNRDGNTGNITDYLLNFTAKTADGEPFVLSDRIVVMTPRDSGRLRRMFCEAAEKSENAAYPPSLLKAAAYEIITEVSRQLMQEDASGGYTSISRALDYIGENCLHEDITVRQLADMCHVSEATLRRMFLGSVGASPKEYINALRLRRAEILLENGGVSVASVAGLVGFSDPSYFSRFFKKHTGKNPTEYM